MNHRTITYVLITAISLAAFSCKTKNPSKTTIPVYIGTYSDEGAEGIYCAEFDTLSGAMTAPVLAAKLFNASYLTFNSNRTLLFAISENDGNSANLFSFSINPETGQLLPSDSLKTNGIASCYVHTTSNNRVMIANYMSGDVSFVSFDEKGNFLGEPLTYQHHGSGPNLLRQEAPHAHSISADLEEKYFYAADLGIDKIVVYTINNDTVIPFSEIEITSGAGPRHLAFHPSGKTMALLNELNNTIEMFTTDEQGVFSMKTQIISLLNDSITSSNTSADIHFSADGNNLYASVRGKNCIEIFAFDKQNNQIENIGAVDNGINWPRNFSLDPSGNFLLVANQKGKNINVFKRDKSSGLLTPTLQSLEINMPVCLLFKTK